MKHNPHRPLDLVLLHLLAVGLLASGLVFLLSGVLSLAHERRPVYVTLALLSLVFGISAFASFWFSLMNLSSRVYLDSHGVRLTRFGKTQTALSWEQIHCAGLCTIHSYRGPEKRFYFSLQPLSADELDDISLARNSVIYFSWFSQREWDYIQAHVHFPLDRQKPI